MAAGGRGREIPQIQTATRTREATFFASSRHAPTLTFQPSTPPLSTPSSAHDRRLLGKDEAGIGEAALAKHVKGEGENESRPSKGEMRGPRRGD